MEVAEEGLPTTTILSFCALDRQSVIINFILRPWAWHHLNPRMSVKSTAHKRLKSVAQLLCIFLKSPPPPRCVTSWIAKVYLLSNLFYYSAFSSSSSSPSSSRFVICRQAPGKVLVMPSNCYYWLVQIENHSDSFTKDICEIQSKWLLSLSLSLYLSFPKISQHY